jgi:orotidine-5'-phosphate decarboxylase
LKPNNQYWKEDSKDVLTLKDVIDYAHELGLVAIDDSKLADIGSTNDAGLYHAKQKGFDAVTVAPFAGNLREAAEQAKKREIGLISMCLMSNPEYEREKNSLVGVNEGDEYHTHDLFNDNRAVSRYIQLAHDAAKFGVDGLVIGAPSKKNHITDKEISIVRHYCRNDMLVLLPGVGAQGGEASSIWKYFSKDNVIVNVGRAVMFPNGSYSTPEQQADAAKCYQKMLNELRNN